MSPHSNSFSEIFYCVAEFKDPDKSGLTNAKTFELKYNTNFLQFVTNEIEHDMVVRQLTQDAKAWKIH